MMKTGVPVSPGVAVARAYCADEVLARGEPLPLAAADLSAEAGRFDTACAAAVRELDAIILRVSQQVGPEEAAIFQAHRLLVRDPAGPAVEVTPVDTVAALAGLGPQVSFLPRLKRPLARLASVLHRTGGLRMVRYREARDLAPVVADLVGDGTAA